MPVEDRPVHAMTVKTKPHAGCWSAVPVRRVPVKHAMSRDCRQVDFDILPECVGCQVIKDREYIDRQREVLRNQEKNRKL